MTDPPKKRSLSPALAPWTGRAPQRRFALDIILWSFDLLLSYPAQLPILLFNSIIGL